MLIFWKKKGWQMRMQIKTLALAIYRYTYTYPRSFFSCKRFFTGRSCWLHFSVRSTFSRCFTGTGMLWFTFSNISWNLIGFFLDCLRWSTINWCFANFLCSSSIRTAIRFLFTVFSGLVCSTRRWNIDILRFSCSWSLFLYGGPSVPLFTNVFYGKTGALNGNFTLNGCFKPEFFS